MTFDPSLPCVSSHVGNTSVSTLDEGLVKINARNFHSTVSSPLNTHPQKYFLSLSSSLFLSNITLAWGKNIPLPSPPPPPSHLPKKKKLLILDQMSYFLHLGGKCTVIHRLKHIFCFTFLHIVLSLPKGRCRDNKVGNKSKGIADGGSTVPVVLASQGGKKG